MVEQEQREGSEGGERDQRESIVIGQYIGLAAHLLAEQLQPLGIEKRAIRDHLAIGGGELLHPGRDNGIGEQDLLDEDVRVELLADRHEGAQRSGGHQRAEALGKEEDDQEVDDESEPLGEHRRKSLGHHRRQEHRRARRDHRLAQHHVAGAGQIGRVAVHEGAGADEKQRQDMGEIHMLGLHQKRAEQAAGDGGQKDDRIERHGLVVDQAVLLEKAGRRRRLFRGDDAEYDQHRRHVDVRPAEHPAQIDERRFPVELDRGKEGEEADGAGQQHAEPRRLEPPVEPPEGEKDRQASEAARQNQVAEDIHALDRLHPRGAVSGIR